MDVIVLACTHFPLLQAELQATAGPDVRFIDGAEGIARRIAYLTEGQDWPAVASPGTAVFTRSDERPPPPLAALEPIGIGRLAPIIPNLANPSHWMPADFRLIAPPTLAPEGADCTGP